MVQLTLTATATMHATTERVRILTNTYIRPCMKSPPTPPALCCLLRDTQPQQLLTTMASLASCIFCKIVKGPYKRYPEGWASAFSVCLLLYPKYSY